MSKGSHCGDIVLATGSNRDVYLGLLNPVTGDRTGLQEGLRLH